MRGILTTSLLATVFLGSSPAYASSLGNESSGTMNIVVVIPPLGDAVRAQENGATGLWAIVNGNGGLMIDAPNTVLETGDLKVELLSPSASQFQIRPFGGEFSSNWKTVDRSGQLSRATLNLPLSDLSVWNYNPLNDRSKLYVIGTI